MANWEPDRDIAADGTSVRHVAFLLLAVFFIGILIGGAAVVVVIRWKPDNPPVSVKSAEETPEGGNPNGGQIKPAKESVQENLDDQGKALQGNGTDTPLSEVQKIPER